MTHKAMKESKEMNDRCGRVILTRGQVEEADFAKYSVWREYQSPEEFLLLREYGATQDWIDRQIVDRLEEGDIWYALMDGQAAPVSEFMVVSTTFWMHTRLLHGYVTLVDGRLSSGTIFQPHVMLSTSDLLDDENCEALEVLSRETGVPREHLLPLRYELDRSALNKALWPIAAGVLAVALPHA